MSKKLLLKKVKKSLIQTFIGFKVNIPIFLGVLLLIAIVQQYIPLSFLWKIEQPIVANILANIIWSISAGNPINSYIIATEFWPVAQQWIIIAIFLVARVTVGVVQIPAESYYFGKKYAIVRNILAFFSCFVAGYIIYYFYLII